MLIGKEPLDEHVRCIDPAIDWSLGATPPSWVKERRAAELVLLPGKRPRIFRCKRLTLSEQSWVGEAGDNNLDLLTRAFRVAVREVVDANATWRPAGTEDRKYQCMTMDEASRFYSLEIQEIGGLILERSAIPPDCWEGYTLQPSYAQRWAAKVKASLRAEPSQNTPTPTPSEPAASSGG